MRHLITSLLLLLPFWANAQSSIPQGSPTTLVINKGGLRVDSAFILPADTNLWITLTSGIPPIPTPYKTDLAILKADSGLYYKKGNNYVKVATLQDLVQGDTNNVFTGTLSQSRALTSTPNAIVLTDYGGGLFVRNDTVTVDNTGTQIINASGQGYSRVYDNETLVSGWFDSLQSSATAARNLSKNLFIDRSYRLVSPVTFYTSTEQAEKTILKSVNATAQINLNNNLSEISVTPSTVTGLTTGSIQTNLRGYENATLVLRSSAEVLMPRYGGSDYMKRQTFKIIDGNGALSNPLQMTFTNTDSMTVRVIPFEGARTIKNLHVEIDTMVSAYSVIINRMSNVTFENLYLRNNDSMAYGSVGFASNSSANVEFNNPVISGFSHAGDEETARLGYGILLTDNAHVRVNNANIDRCKHVVMNSFVTDFRMTGGVVKNTNNLQVIDAHWVDGMVVDGVKIYGTLSPNNASHGGVGVAGGNITVKNCTIYNARGMLAISASTPELYGNVFLENNTIYYPDSISSYIYYMGMFSNSTDYGTTFNRTLRQPDLIAIRNNKYVNTNIVPRAFFVYRGVTSLINRTSVKYFDIQNNIAIGNSKPPTSFSPATHLYVRDENVSNVNPVINLVNQDFQPYDYVTSNASVSLSIGSRYKSRMAQPYAYEVIVNNSKGFSTQVDVDACNRFDINNSDVISTNGKNPAAIDSAGTEIKTPSFEYNIANSTIGKQLPSGLNLALLFLSSAKLNLRDVIVHANYKLNSVGSAGITQFTNFGSGISSAYSVKVIKDSQRDTATNAVIDVPFPNDGWVSTDAYVKLGEDLRSSTTAIPTTSDIQNNKAMLVRYGDQSVAWMANANGTIRNINYVLVAGTINSSTSITPTAFGRFDRLNSAANMSVGINSSAYSFTGLPLVFRNISTGIDTIKANAGVTITGGNVLVAAGGEAELKATSANTYAVVRYKYSAVDTGLARKADTATTYTRTTSDARYEQLTNKKNTITQSTTDYTSGAAVYTLVDTNVVTAVTTLTLTKRGMYTFTGTNSTWTIPAVAGNTGLVYYIYNRGSGSLTVNTTAAANNIDSNGAITNTIVLAPGDNLIIRNNSINYIVQ